MKTNKLIVGILFAFLAAWLMPCAAWARPALFGGTGVSKDSNCDQSKYYAIGILCQDTDDGKLYKGTGAAVVEITAGGTDLSGVTGFVNVSGGVASGVTPVDTTEFGYLDGVTSAIQTQLNAKQAASGNLDLYSGVTPSANVQTMLGSADNAAIRSNIGADAAYAPIFITGDITSVLDDTTGAVPVLMQAATAFASGATEPSVAGHSVFITANAVSTVYSDFAGGTDGQILIILVNDALSGFDFTSSGLEGTSADYTATDGEIVMFVYSAVDNQWHYLGFPKTLSTVTIGGGTANSYAYWNNAGSLSSGVTPVKEFIWDPVSGVTNTSDVYFKIVESGVTLQKIDAMCYTVTESGCSVTLVFMECDSSGANCANSHTPLTVQATGTNTTATNSLATFSDAVIDRQDYIKLDVSSGTTVTGLTVTLQYYVGP